MGTGKRGGEMKKLGDHVAGLRYACAIGVLLLVAGCGTSGSKSNEAFTDRSPRLGSPTQASHGHKSRRSNARSEFLTSEEWEEILRIRTYRLMQRPPSRPVADGTPASQTNATQNATAPTLALPAIAESAEPPKLSSLPEGEREYLTAGRRFREAEERYRRTQEKAKDLEERLRKKADDAPAQIARAERARSREDATDLIRDARKAQALVARYEKATDDYEKAANDMRDAGLALEEAAQRLSQTR